MRNGEARGRFWNAPAGLLLGALVVGLLTTGGVASAEEGQTAPGATYVGHETCQTCHPQQMQKFAQTRMGKIFLRGARDDLEKWACESCHGPGSAHVSNPVDPTTILRYGKNSPASVEERNASCLQCHEKGFRTYWAGSAHEARGMACTDCHRVMERTSDRSQLVRVGAKSPFSEKRAESEVCFQCHLERRAQLQRSSHMPLREGNLTCTDCHNPHGTATPALLSENSVNENCYRCHAEKRGPFLWEHAPARESCLNCHEAHGSMHASLLKARMPRLCQRCHIETRHPTTPFSPTSRFVFNRACTNCHPQVHGSNHPSGVRFQR